ncbi:MAG: hypothetical protein ABH818_03090 [Patescibacteria group bacterium]|nr:hypothetical protein [Patescibacteria group bacterium]MBU1870757.1 hypothetical protein [Patescibacteria group bacterium]
MKNLLTLKFWLNLRPDSLTPLAQKKFLALIVAFIFFTIVFGYIKSRQKKSLYVKLWQNLYYFGLTNSFVSLFLIFFNYELIPFLSARFWYLLWFIGIGIWLFFIVKTILEIPKRRQRLEQEKEYKRYIP